MKITNIHIPDMTKHYIGYLDLQNLSAKLAESYVKLDEEKISIYMKDDPEISKFMRLIKEKCEPITIGNGKFRVYEYELAYSENSGHIFMIAVDGKDYYCTLESVYNIENGDLHIEFRII